MGHRSASLFNVPNILSLYRICTAPLAVAAAVVGAREIFAILIVVSLASDWIDGVIARKFDQRSELGARLDTLGDNLTLLAGAIGLLVLEWVKIRPELPWAAAYFVVLAISIGLSLGKFGSMPAYHLYLSKAAAVLVAVFFVSAVTLGFSPWFFKFTLAVGIIAKAECILVTLALKRDETDLRSLFWVLARRRGQSDQAGGDG